MEINKISVIGLGYVGLPLAVAFAENGLETIGFDINSNKIAEYTASIDNTHEVGSERLRKAKGSGKISFTSDPAQLYSCDFNIIAVPTPINKDHTPDLSLVEEATKIIATNLKPGAYVVYESTVYPGVTEEACIPILEEISGMKCGCDFKVGYSPERINPGDRRHTLENVIKVVSGIDEESLNVIANIYGIVAKAGIHKASSIRIAEAAKVIENAQRDINIAFMNELALIFDKLDIDTKQVLLAAKTKWNFLDFKPGLVGGHCIGVDPYYLTYKASMAGYQPEVILAGRRINDNMGKMVAQQTIKMMIQAGIPVKGAHVGILGLTFKENCPDTRNSKVFDIIEELDSYGAEIIATDSHAVFEEASNHQNVVLHKLEELKDLDAVILAVAHDSYKELDIAAIRGMYKEGLPQKTLVDVKGIVEIPNDTEEFMYWRL